ncbi:AraC family transcriptional regulator [Amycolatopsis sp. A133]|uniref:AraC family transcriptional regulator n=1 Tax=Amycolatopsis sp. A133 TaxID=3064472 RepID=UPI0027F85609|nr:AraC family transcriptional regulator [Amycolatopsis sp. A133]MDQ7807494.1 AraC family transcriptional regulator [Amycolatopsis sp. A133]
MTAPSQALDHRSLIVEKHASGANGDLLRCRPSGSWLAIIALLRGACRIEGQDRRGRRGVTLLTGEICRVAPSAQVRLRRTPPDYPPFEVAYIWLSVEVLHEVAGKCPETTFRDPAELHTLQEFDSHVASMAPVLLHDQDAAADDCRANIAAHYLATHLLYPRRIVAAREGNLTSEQLSAVTGYMLEHLSSGVTLDQLAEQAGVSRYHFIRQFAATTGKTPMKYLAELRIDAARHRLTADSEPISRVGRRCGFPNPDNFARTFRKHVGCTPSQYRMRTRPA